MRIPARTGAVTIAALSLVLASACRGRPRSWDVPVDTERPREGGAAVLEIDMSSGAPEKTSGGLLSLPSRHTFDVLVAALKQAEGRKEVKGVFVAFGASSLGWARAHELGDGLARLKSKGVSVLCHADAWDNTTYAAAARGCDTIAMSPAGEVEATGPASAIPYARELLEDKLHAQVDILQVGKFKGAAEPLTLDGPSDEYRTSIERALSAIANANKEALAIRGVAELVGTGPYMGKETVDKKLVDLLLDRKGAREEAKKRAQGVPVEVVYGPGGGGGAPKVGLLDFFRLLMTGGDETSARPHVQLVRLHGEIALGSEGGLLGAPAGIVSRKVVEDARALAKDDNVKAVVLRIDSPGGSALGSDLAWLAVKELRDKKPVIVSIGEMAASGGYYIASAGTKLYAEPESIVGSIGVVGGKISFRGSLALVGIHTASFGDPRAAQLASITEPWDPATRARLQESMNQIYALFLERISDGRGKPKEHFDEAVEGRVFGGLQAKELGLVDEIGGLGDAIAEAKRAGNLPDGAPVVTDAPESFLGALTGDDDELHALSTVAGPIPARIAPELWALRAWVLGFVRATGGGGVAAMLPTPLIIR
jgi:protease IV